MRVVIETLFVIAKYVEKEKYSSWGFGHTMVKIEHRSKNNDPDLYYHIEQSWEHIGWEKQVADLHTHTRWYHSQNYLKPIKAYVDVLATHVRKCPSGAFTLTSWKWLPLMSKEGNGKKGDVLVWDQQKPEPKIRSSSGTAIARSGERKTGRGEKPINRALIRGLLLWQRSLTGDPLKSHKGICLRLDPQRDEESETLFS